MSEDDEKLAFLTPFQIAFYKKKIMNGIVNDIIKNTKANLFGGAVRDMIGRKIRQDNTLPLDLDFFATTQKDYDELMEYVETTYHVVCTRVRHSEYHWTLHKVRIPIFHSTVELWPENLCVLIDLVLMESLMKRQDFDVNTLVLNRVGVLSDSHYPVQQILQHIKEKKAYLLPQSEVSDLSYRCSALIHRDWTIVTFFGEFTRIDETNCHNNDKNSARISQKLSSGVQTPLCFPCFQDFFC